VAVWQSLHGADQQRLVVAYMQRAGFRATAMNASLPLNGGPLWTVVGIAWSTRALGQQIWSEGRV